MKIYFVGLGRFSLLDRFEKAGFKFLLETLPSRVFWDLLVRFDERFELTLFSLFTGVF